MLLITNVRKLGLLVGWWVGWLVVCWGFLLLLFREFCFFLFVCCWLFGFLVGFFLNASHY